MLKIAFLVGGRGIRGPFLLVEGTLESFSRYWEGHKRAFLVNGRDIIEPFLLRWEHSL